MLYGICSLTRKERKIWYNLISKKVEATIDGNVVKDGIRIKLGGPQGSLSGNEKSLTKDLIVPPVAFQPHCSMFTVVSPLLDWPFTLAAHLLWTTLEELLLPCSGDLLE